jgi:hypothetical protein
VGGGADAEVVVAYCGVGHLFDKISEGKREKGKEGIRTWSL